MEYLIRFAQTHETFRRPEIEALASLVGVDVEFVLYDRYVCFPLFFFLFSWFGYIELHFLLILNCPSCGISSPHVCFNMNTHASIAN